MSDDTPPPDRVAVEAAIKRFLVIGPGYFGFGESIKEARTNCMKEGCKAKDHLIAYAGSSDLSFTGGGYVSATFMIRIGEV